MDDPISHLACGCRDDCQNYNLSHRWHLVSWLRFHFSGSLSAAGQAREQAAASVVLCGVQGHWRTADCIQVRGQKAKGLEGDLSQTKAPPQVGLQQASWIALPAQLYFQHPLFSHAKSKMAAFASVYDLYSRRFFTSYIPNMI